MLRDRARLARGHVRLSYRVQERRLPVVDVAQNRHHGRPRWSVRGRCPARHHLHRRRRRGLRLLNRCRLLRLFLLGLDLGHRLGLRLWFLLDDLRLLDLDRIPPLLADQQCQLRWHDAALADRLPEIAGGLHDVLRLRVERRGELRRREGSLQPDRLLPLLGSLLRFGRRRHRRRGGSRSFRLRRLRGRLLRLRLRRCLGLDGSSLLPSQASAYLPQIHWRHGRAGRLSSDSQFLQQQENFPARYA